ncbi:hypothetical protein HO173_007538 [Letharia columbiana]|uniref:Uncharacterized protein n=1 Tax=Letharia columbiana TaxID=112416 RepID=A0A8H6FSY9_9LECA|nr:uncharacterized protein HO173_007538 [Letharia columbiana]KAF6234119.1 hypothetical protein HO173_007538 [Letharia columbiana]
MGGQLYLDLGFLHRMGLVAGLKRLRIWPSQLLALDNEYNSQNAVYPVANQILLVLKKTRNISPCEIRGSLQPKLLTYLVSNVSSENVTRNRTARDAGTDQVFISEAAVTLPLFWARRGRTAHPKAEAQGSLPVRRRLKSCTLDGEKRMDAIGQRASPLAETGRTLEGEAEIFSV